MSSMIPIVYYEGHEDNVPKSENLEWEELVSELLVPFPPTTCLAETCVGKECIHKLEGLAWSPIVIDGKRKKENVRAVSALVFDLDHMGESTLDDVMASLQGYSAVLHTTHNHRPPTDLCYRLIMPFSRLATPIEWAKIRPYIRDELHLPTDEQTKSIANMFFLPSQRIGIEPKALVLKGAVLDVDIILDLLGHTPIIVPVAPTPSIIAIDLDTIREEIAQVRIRKSHGDEYAKEQSEILGRILDGKPLATPGTRDAVLVRACGMISHIIDATVPFEVVLELLRPSLSTMDCTPDGFDYWVQLAERKYSRTLKHRIELDIENERVLGLIKASVAATKHTAAPTADDIGDDWEETLRKTKSGRVVGNESNTFTLLTCHPDIKGTFCWNEVTKEIEITEGPFKDTPISSLEVACASWLQKNCKFDGRSTLIGPVVAWVARENSYDPVAEFLGELSWDDVPRINTFFEKYLGIETTGADGKTITDHIRRISRRWLISLVARALEPGCKADNVLVLEGKQGAGKSTALRALVGPEYFFDSALVIGSKDAMQSISGTWLVELAELASFERTESPTEKQFFSSQVDKFRPPFGRVVEDSPRRCVFVGTTNKDVYLKDKTGNRRYWTVKTTDINIEAIKQDRLQILAEAVMAYAAGEQWHLEPEEELIAEAQAEDRLDASPHEEAVESWWFGLAPGKRPTSVSMIEIASAINVAPDRLNRSIQTEIGCAMRRLGFRRARKMEGGMRTYYYFASKALLEAPQQLSAAKQSILALVPKAPANG